MENKPNPQNQDYQRLKKYQKIWRKKKIIQKIYQDWYKKINQDLYPGKTLEIGSGTGNFKQFSQQIIKLLKNSHYYQKLSWQALKNASLYDWNKVAKNELNLIKNLELK